MKPAKIKTATYETWLPCFPGYYESPLYNYDIDTSTVEGLINALSDEALGFPRVLMKAFIAQSDTPERWKIQMDFETYKQETAWTYCECLEDLGTDYRVMDWPVRKIKFKELKSPKGSSYGTDVVICRVDVVQGAILDYVRASMESFTQYLKERYPSPTGMRSLYSPDPDNFLDANNWADDPCIVGYLLDFIARDQLGPNAELILCGKVSEELYAGDFYSFPEVVDDWLYTRAAFNIGKEYDKIRKQCEEYVNIMGEKYRPAVDAHMKRVVANLVDEMNNSICNFEERRAH